MTSCVSCVRKQVRMYRTHTHTLLKTTHIEHQKLCENVPEGGGVWVQMNEDRCACDMCLLKVQNRQTENIVEVYIDR
jgi:hypothetical protein